MNLVKIICLVLLLSSCTGKPDPTPLPAFPELSELLALMEADEATSVSIVTELLRRAGDAEHLNAFITLDSDGALERARALDDMRRKGISLGPLHGVPIVVKDNIHVAGLPNTAGTPGLAKFTPSKDNAVVAALKDAGAIILGKTNLHELAFGITSDNVAYGSVANPFDTSKFAGGSSGGTASAISAGLAPAGLGTDTGGSVRIPPALTGIVGFRPSTGRYESTAVTPISHTRDTIGLLGRSVADIVLMDGVIDGARPAIVSVSPHEIRLGVPRAYYYQNLDPQSALVVDAALGKLADAGVTLIEVDPGNVGPLLDKSAFPIALYEFVRDLPAYLDRYDTDMDYAGIAAAAASPDVVGLFASLEGESKIPDAVYESALAARTELRVIYRNYFNEYRLDAMIFPTTVLPSRAIEGSVQSVELNGEQVATLLAYIHNTDPASIAALPGLSLPVGLTQDGLPVGIEIDGPEGSDSALLGIAVTLEGIIEFSARP
jgi:mandelamide amidase